jgi:cellulose synthase/poly-beta-1,6-N-acetylglucosamine synthase-like glycosyltransferase
VATYNEEKRIIQKLDDLTRQNYPHQRMNVIVVDSSLDSTRQLVRQWAFQHPRIDLVLIEELTRMGLAHALNLGYQSATGDIVIKSDCDIMLERDAIRTIVSTFADPRVGAVSGKQLLSNDSKVEGGYRKALDRKRTIESKFGAVFQFDPFCAFRKSLIEKISEKSVADDAEMAIKTRRKGFATLFEQKAIFFESTPRGVVKRLLQKQRRAQGHIIVAIQNRDILFRKEFGLFGMVFFPITFAMLVVNPWLVIAMISSLGIAYLLNLSFLGGLFGTVVIATAALIYLTQRPSLLAGFLESQLALIIGWIHLIIYGREYKWTMSRE